MKFCYINLCLLLLITIITPLKTIYIFHYYNTYSSIKPKYLYLLPKHIEDIPKSNIIFSIAFDSKIYSKTWLYLNN